MKFTLSWLKDHLDTNASVDEITETLTDLGLEVEEVVNPLDTLSAFTVGFVREAEQHVLTEHLLRNGRHLGRTMAQVHTTLQVQPSRHFLGTNGLHPIRCCRGQIQCDDVVTGKNLF